MVNSVPAFNYIPSPTGVSFHDSDERVKMVTGPYGSGKTCMVMNDALFYALSQAPAPDGVRYTRIGVIRGTYPELQTTTRKAILEVFPRQFGTILEGGQPLRGAYRFPVGDGPYDYLTEGRPWHEGDGTIACVEFILQALDGAGASDKIRSANWSFAIINEATTVEFDVVAAVLGRIGRYPSEDMGGCSYAGLLMDFNQPAPGHWLIDLMEHPEQLSVPTRLWRQPPAASRVEDENGHAHYEVNPDAENLRNLGAARKPDDFNSWTLEAQNKFLVEKGMAYYADQINLWLSKGRTDVVDSLFCMKSVPVREGKPVFDTFKVEDHVLKTDLVPVLGHPVIIGCDTSGIHPACVLVQHQGEQWVVLDEIYGEGEGLGSFLEQSLLPLINSRYMRCPVVVSCDPANAKDSYYGLSPTEHFQSHGLTAVTPDTNDPRTRIRAVESMLNKRVGGLVINPGCALLTTAMNGGYHFRKLRLYGTVEDAYDPKPEKNRYSHVADALQYACLYIVREDVEITRESAHLVEALSRRRSTMRNIL